MDKLDAGAGKLFPPLIDENTPFVTIKNCLMQQRSTLPTINENLTAHPLPSNKYIKNYLAGVKVCYN